MKSIFALTLIVCLTLFSLIEGFSLSAERSARLARQNFKATRETQIDERAAPCLVDADCLFVHTENCQNWTCNSFGFCQQTDYFCPPTTTICTVNPGVCSLLDNICHYPAFNCDDGDPCTNDSCFNDHNVSTCINLPIPNCVNNFTHRATLRVVDVSVLDLLPFPDDNVVQFCHISTYRGPDSALLLSFDPYQPCTLNERGTCDNRFSEPEPIETDCVFDPTNGAFPCLFGNDPLPHSLSIEGLVVHLGWASLPLEAISILDEVAGTLHVHGFLYDLDGFSTIELRADLWFSGLTHSNTSASLKLPSPCQNTSGWLYFTTLTGVLDGKMGSDYQGLHIKLSLKSGTVAQLGKGANNVNNIDQGLYASIHWDIIAQPINSSFLIDQGSFVDGNITLAIDGLCSDTIDYCDMYGEPQETPGNLWEVDLNNDDLLLNYCRNFSIEQLLNCRNFSDPISQLFTYVNTNVSTIIYSGTLYATTLENSDECVGCAGEEIVSQATYNISITISSGGDASYSFTTAYTDFAVFWISNVWMCGPEDGGNLKVNLKTRIRDDDSFPDVQLCQPYVDTTDETGYPLVFVEPLDPPCQMINDYCYQNWVLRTFDGNNVVDFSGFKSLFWMVCEDDVVTGRVGASLDLFAVHVGDQDHVDDGNVQGALQLFTDRQFQIPYDHQTLLEGTFLYGTLCLTNHFHLDVHVKHVYYCYSTEGDIIPYDSMNPSTTGCNTQGLNVQKLLIYTTEFSEEDLLVNPLFFHYEQLNNPPTTADCEGFTFKVRAVTRYAQSVQFTWCAQENGGAGGLIEMISEYHKVGSGSGYQRHLTDQDVDEDTFFVSCLEDSWIFDEDTFHCRPIRHSDDDDEDWDWGEDTMGTWGILFGILIFLFVGAIIFWYCIAHSHWFQEKTYSYLEVPQSPVQEKLQEPSPPFVPQTMPPPITLPYSQPTQISSSFSQIASQMVSRRKKTST
jgi:hypothetical protein